MFIASAQKLRKALLNKSIAREMLVKLTPVRFFFKSAEN
jgi:hypothetical protein